MDTYNFLVMINVDLLISTFASSYYPNVTHHTLFQSFMKYTVLNSFVRTKLLSMCERIYQISCCNQFSCGEFYIACFRLRTKFLKSVCSLIILINCLPIKLRFNAMKMCPCYKASIIRQEILPVSVSKNGFTCPYKRTS